MIPKYQSREKSNQPTQNQKSKKKNKELTKKKKLRN